MEGKVKWDLEAQVAKELQKVPQDNAATIEVNQKGIEGSIGIEKDSWSLVGWIQRRWDGLWAGGAKGTKRF